MKKLIYSMLVVMVLTACRHDDIIYPPDNLPVYAPEFTSVEGFYLLNEGNMGSNKSTLDYYDCLTGVYTRNIYGNANPNVPKEMGDVGNDITVYGNRLYAVINCSNKVEVMDVKTTKRIGQIDIPNCRYIKFHKGYAYVTSYAGPVEINPNYQQIGYVAKVDTASLEVIDRCLVGFQPDGLEIMGNRIYVANSGGYMVPNYESTVSVIDIDTFEEVDRIDVAVNLHYVMADSHSCLWISSRGDYYDTPSRLYCYDVRDKRMAASLDVPVSDMCIQGDSIYVVSAGWSHVTSSYNVTYSIIDINLKAKVTDNFITDGSDAKIKMPYGVAVHPITKDIYVTDAKNYVNPGALYCFSNEGILKWSVRTGDIPAHFAFVGEQTLENE